MMTPSPTKTRLQSRRHTTARTVLLTLPPRAPRHKRLLLELQLQALHQAMESKSWRHTVGPPEGSRPWKSSRLLTSTTYLIPVPPTSLSLDTLTELQAVGGEQGQHRLALAFSKTTSSALALFQSRTMLPWLALLRLPAWTIQLRHPTRASIHFTRSKRSRYLLGFRLSTTKQSGHVLRLPIAR